MHKTHPLGARVCYLKKEESKILLAQAEPRKEKLKKKRKKKYIYIYIMIQRKRSSHLLSYTGEHNSNSQSRRRK